MGRYSSTEHSHVDLIERDVDLSLKIAWGRRVEAKEKRDRRRRLMLDGAAILSLAALFHIFINVIGVFA